MDVDVAGRAQGKTYRLVEWFRSDPEHRVIVVLTEAQRQYIIVTYEMDSKEVARVLVPGPSMRGWPITTRVGVDNAEYFIAQALGVAPAYVAINGTPIR